MGLTADNFPAGRTLANQMAKEMVEEATGVQYNDFRKHLFHWEGCYGES